MSDHSREQLFVATNTTTTTTTPANRKTNLSTSSSSSSKPLKSPSSSSSLLANESNIISHLNDQQQQQKGNKFLTTSCTSSSSKYLSIELNNNSIVRQPTSGDRTSGLLNSNEYLKSKLMMADSPTINKQQLQQQQEHPTKPEVKPVAANGSLSTIRTITSNNHTPAYPSIFTSPTYKRSISPQQEIKQQQQQPRQNTIQSTKTTAARRGSQLKKQDAGDNLEIPTLNLLDRTLSSHKKSSTFEFAGSNDVKQANERDNNDDDDDENDDYEQEDDEDEDEEDDDGSRNKDDADELESDDLGNEKKPFRSSSNLVKLKHPQKNRKGVLSSTVANHHNHNHNHHNPHRCQASFINEQTNKKSTTRCNAQQQVDLSHKSPYSKISFSESRPPSFNTCQAAYNHYHQHELNPNATANANGFVKLNSGNLQQLPFVQQCYGCNCTKCLKKLKLVDSNGYSTSIQMDPYEKTYTRTKSLHLVLKSIILVLLTLLLLMMFVGIIMAGHYLPSVFDRVLNATRSFNVTIAG